MKNSLNRAFTLVELMVAIAIIALLTGIIVVNLAGSKAKSRDAQRVSDLAQIQLALGLYFDRCNQFPASIADVSATNGCPITNPQVNLGSYIAKIPTPPAGAGQTVYDYVLNTPKTDYILRTVLENPNAAATANGLQTNVAGDNTYGLTCSNAIDSVNYCIGPK